MNCVLAVDSASELMSVCLKKGNAYFEMTVENGLKHSETLMQTILLILNEADIERKDLDLLVCSEGPGSFTGLRIGMSTIKGLAYGLDLPYTAVPSSDYMAWGLDYFDGLVVPLLDARKKRFYCGFYFRGARVDGPCDLSIEDIIAKTEEYGKVLFTGPDSTMIPPDAREGIYYDPNSRCGRSRQLLTLGLKRFEEEGPLPENAGPLYLRRSEAEIALYGEKS